VFPQAEIISQGLFYPYCQRSSAEEIDFVVILKEQPTKKEEHTSSFSFF
jgi:hypothetical protein